MVDSARPQTIKVNRSLTNPLLAVFERERGNQLISIKFNERLWEQFAVWSIVGRLR